MFYFIQFDQHRFLYNYEFIKKLAAMVYKKNELIVNIVHREFMFEGLEYTRRYDFWCITDKQSQNGTVFIHEESPAFFLSQIDSAAAFFAVVYDGCNLYFIKNPGTELINKLFSVYS